MIGVNKLGSSSARTNFVNPNIKTLGCTNTL